MIEVREFYPSDLRAIKSAEQGGDDSAELHLKYGPSATVTVDGIPVACGGVHLLWSGMAEAWGSIEPAELTPHVLLAYRKVLDGWIDEHKLRRVQAVTIFGWEQGYRFLRFLGFHLEAHLRLFWPKADGVLFARFSDV